MTARYLTDRDVATLRRVVTALGGDPRNSGDDLGRNGVKGRLPAIRIGRTTTDHPGATYNADGTIASAGLGKSRFYHIFGDGSGTKELDDKETPTLNTFPTELKSGTLCIFHRDQTLKHKTDPTRQKEGYIAQPLSKKAGEVGPFIFRTIILTIRMDAQTDIIQINPHSAAGGYFFPLTDDDADLTDLPNPLPDWAWNKYHLSAFQGDDIVIIQFPQGPDEFRKWIVIQVEEHAPCFVRGRVHDQAGISQPPATTNIGPLSGDWLSDVIGGVPPRPYLKQNLPAGSALQLIDSFLCENPYAKSGPVSTEVLVCLGPGGAIIVEAPGSANANALLSAAVSGAIDGVTVTDFRVDFAFSHTSDAGVFKIEGDTIRVMKTGKYKIKWTLRCEMTSEQAETVPPGTEPDAAIGTLIDRAIYHVTARRGGVAIGPELEGQVFTIGGSGGGVLSGHDTLHTGFDVDLNANDVIELWFDSVTVHEDDMAIVDGYLEIVPA